MTFAVAFDMPCGMESDLKTDARKNPGNLRAVRMTMVASTPERAKSYFKDKHVSHAADSQ